MFELNQRNGLDIINRIENGLNGNIMSWQVTIDLHYCVRMHNSISIVNVLSLFCLATEICDCMQYILKTFAHKTTNYCYMITQIMTLGHMYNCHLI